jgi:hypothetical protein
MIIILFGRSGWKTGSEREDRHQGLMPQEYKFGTGRRKFQKIQMEPKMILARGDTVKMGVVIGRKMIIRVVIDDSGVCRIFIDSPKGFLAGVEENNNFVHVRKYL